MTSDVEMTGPEKDLGIEKHAHAHHDHAIESTGSRMVKVFPPRIFHDMDHGSYHFRMGRGIG